MVPTDDGTGYARDLLILELFETVRYQRGATWLRNASKQGCAVFFL